MNSGQTNDRVQLLLQNSAKVSNLSILSCKMKRKLGQSVKSCDIGDLVVSTYAVPSAPTKIPHASDEQPSLAYGNLAYDHFSPGMQAAATSIRTTLSCAGRKLRERGVHI